MAKGFGEGEREHIRTALRAAAEQMLRTRGMRHISVEALSEAAFISKGAFYAFYPTKEAFFLELFMELEKAFHDRLITAAAQPGLTPRARLIHVMHETLALASASPLLATTSNEDVELLMRKSPPDALRANDRADIELAARLIETLRAHGCAVTIGAETLYRMFRLLLTLHLGDPVRRDGIDAFTLLVIEALADRALA